MLDELGRKRMPLNGKTSRSPLSSDKVPRQKTCIYLFLLFLTAILIYLYSYPLEINTNIFVFKNSRIANTGLRSRNVSTSDISNSKISTPTDLLKSNDFSTLAGTISSNQEKRLNNTQASSISSILLARLFKTGETLALPRNTSFKATHLPQEENQALTTKIFATTKAVATTKISSTPKVMTTTKKTTTLKKGIVNLANDKLPDTVTKQATTATSRNSKDFPAKNAPENITDVEKGFLVFSKHCKIPDIDPMHPSIRKFVSISPRLNCMKKEPITKTEGNVLILDADAAERRGFKNFTCCYKSIHRGSEGYSDNKIVYGRCKLITAKVNIEDEFVTVVCKDSDEKLIYQEFHSFIHDKPAVEKRCNKQKTPPYSIMIIGIDGISRLNMHRQMNKTVRYLVDNMKAVEMVGYNKIGDNTFPNLVALLMGYDERELSKVCWDSDSKDPLDKCNFLWKRFAEKGYRTLYAEDTPYISTFNYVKKGFFHQPTDYYFRHFILPYEDTLGWYKKSNCHLCVGSVSETEAVLHWVDLFANKFKDRAYFSFSWINSMTHDYLNFGSGADHMYEKFFRTLHQSGALNKTIVIVMADHGMRWGSIRRTFVGRLEERLPMLFVALPPQFQKEYPKETNSLKINSHLLITPFDLHATLLNILHLQEQWYFFNPDNISKELSLNFTKRAHSLFQNVPKDRSCDDAFIEEHWCTCESSLPMDIDNDNIKKVAKFLLQYINSLLKPVSNVCALLKLNSIDDARILSPSSAHTGHSEEDNIYTIIVQTEPGNAVFEGTVRISPPKYDCELLGSISRLNLYGNQSNCVQNAILKKYCFCS